MSMTKEQAIKEFEKDKEYRAGESQRIKPGALDEHYITRTLEFPFNSQRDNLQQAMNEAGVQGTATTQRAYEIHARLRDKIDQELMKIAKDARLKGLNKVLELCESAKSEQVQLTAALAVTKDLFPEVAVTKQETIEDIDQAIEQAEQDIRAGVH